jgi:hypothetical protein
MLSSNYRMDVFPSAFLNIEIKALGLSQPTSIATVAGARIKREKLAFKFGVWPGLGS